MIWTKHPYLKIPTASEAERLSKLSSSEDRFDNKLQELYYAREQRIQLAKDDPWEYGFGKEAIPSWGRADKAIEGGLDVLYIFGGNRSAKSEYCARLVNKFMMDIDQARVACCHSSAASSVQIQQPYVYRYIPKAFKDMPKRRGGNINYSQKGGFGAHSPTFIYPHNQSQCFFMNYTQGIDKLQGNEFDLAWCDELVPMTWIKELSYRLASRNGLLLCSFTPIDGYTSSLKEALKGIKVTEYAHAEMIDQDRPGIPGGPNGQMPVEGDVPNEPGAPQLRKKAVWFFSKDNPWSGYERLKRQSQGRTDAENKIRLYGWVDNANTSKFPRFGPIHIVSPEKIPKHGVNYMSCDPAPDRNWFMLWGRRTPDNKLWIYREWPDRKKFGEWAEESDKPDGKPGVAQYTHAGGNYKTLINEIDRGDNVAERFIDPRAGAASVAADKVGGTSLIDRMMEPATEDNPGEPLIFLPAPGGVIDDGVQAINDLLKWEIDQPVDGTNEPQLFISEECENLIDALYNWTGDGGQTGAYKDPCDALRYMVLMNPQYYDQGHSQVTGETWGY